MAKFGPKFSLDSGKMPRRGRLKLRGGSAAREVGPDLLIDKGAEGGRIDEQFSRRPVVVLSLITLAVVAFLSVRLFGLQIVEGSRYAGLAEGNRIREKIDRAPRGAIYDRNGILLARNIAGFDVSVTPSLLPKDKTERAKAYERVAELLSMPSQTVQNRSENKNQNPLQPQLIATGLDHQQALLVEQDLPRLPGFHLDVNPTRQYLDSGLLSHFLGYIGRIDADDLKKDNTYLPTDYIGKLGIEKQYESVLRGRSGSQQIEVDAQGNPVKVLASVQPQIGHDIKLTIDFKLEQVLAENLKKQVERSGATRASAVAIDPRDGQVLAAVSLPTYDGNLFAKGISTRDYERLINDKAQPLFNKAIGGAYPTGSIIKPIVASSVLQEHVVSPNTTVDDTGAGLEIPNRYNPSIKYVFKSYEPGGLGIVNITTAIQKSSNIFFYTVAGGFGSITGIGAEKLGQYMHKFGLGEATGIDVPGETAGRVPTPEWKKQATGETWYLGDTYNLGVGQGDFLASPLQMAVAEGAVANGGKIFQPKLLKQVMDGNKVAKDFKATLVRQGFIDQDNLNIVRNAMHLVSTDGTARFLFTGFPVQVGAKTGTAETDPNGHRKPHSWFTAFAPYGDPQIEIVALVENAGEGANFAGPAVRDTLKWYFSKDRK